jgi:drug/metabolite transporter (DMT)-like permease
MLLATFLALGAAVLHATWNFVAKRADGDRYLVLWAQFLCGGLVALPLMVGYQLWFGMPWQAYVWAGSSGIVHVPYVWLLGRAYNHGDFSVSYPIARGGGAALAALGGVLFLADHLTLLQVCGIAIIVIGLATLAYGAIGPDIALALCAALTIGVYTLFDSRGSRLSTGIGYIFASFVATMITNTAGGLALGRRAEMVAMLRGNWRRSFLTGVASMVTYGMVLVAVRHASVGYVAALRESSVVLAALAGWRLLGEGDHRRRLSAALVVLAGLVVLIAGR